MSRVRSHSTGELSRFIDLFAEIYRFREVLQNLLSQDFKLKYKRTFLGYFWSLLNPLLQLAVLTTVFSHIVRLQMRDYSLFLFSGFIAWTFFQNALVSASISLLEGEGFIKKTYLPKILFPLSKLCLRAVEFLFALVALGILGALFGYPFHVCVLLLPFAILSLFVFTLGVSLTLAVATVYFRDITYLLGVFLQLLYFGTPIMYPASQLPAKFARYLRLNPLVSQIDLFQRILYDGIIPSFNEWALAYGLAFLFLGLGLWVLVRFDEDIVFRM